MTTQKWGVKGLTDKPRAPIVAKAKIGERGPKGEPRRLDHIIFVEPQTGNHIPEFEDIFGAKPTSFKALLPADSLEEVADVAWKRYGKTGLKCRGDGETGFDRETGEERECAGPYNYDDPSQHACEHAKPKGKNPPACKPILSMRLITPQIPTLGIVQLDTGGVASSVQTLVWQLQRMAEFTRDEHGHEHLSGIAVEVSIKPFRDRFGNTAFAWQLQALTEEESRDLRANIEGAKRVQIQKLDIPALADTTADSDVYGLPEPEVEVAVEPTEDNEGPPADMEDTLHTARVQLKNAIQRLPKARSKEEVTKAQEMREVVEKTHNWTEYIEWMTQRAYDIDKELSKEQSE